MKTFNFLVTCPAHSLLLLPLSFTVVVANKFHFLLFNVFIYSLIITCNIFCSAFPLLHLLPDPPPLAHPLNFMFFLSLKRNQKKQNSKPKHNNTKNRGFQFMLANYSWAWACPMCGRCCSVYSMGEMGFPSPRSSQLCRASWLWVRLCDHFPSSLLGLGLTNVFHSNSILVLQSWLLWRLLSSQEYSKLSPIHLLGWFSHWHTRILYVFWIPLCQLRSLQTCCWVCSFRMWCPFLFCLP